MSNRKEGASGSSGGFWRKNSSAIPGRPNPSSHSSSSLISNQVNHKNHGELRSSLSVDSASGASSSFKDFEQSVSDAWDIQDLKDHSKPAEMVEIIEVHGSHPSASASNSSANHNKNEADPNNSNNVHYLKGEGKSCNDLSKNAKLEALVASSSIEIEDLRRLSWPGLSSKARAKAWKILCGYLPGQASRQSEVIQRKQEEYQRYVDQYFATKDQDVHQDTYRQIHIDIPRMSPVVGLFQQRPVQEIFERILYIWAIRHPASGYVQGINDLVTPFFLVFLRDTLDQLEQPNPEVPDLEVAKVIPLERRNSIEADSFWCLTAVLDGIQDNYTFAQPGIQLKVKQLEDLIQRIDTELHNHLVSHDVSYLQFSFRWMNNLLMRELPVKASIRLWDTYLSQVNGFSHFHLYVCAAFLIHWKAELMKKHDFHTLLMFLQNLPTAKWGDQEINLLVAEAYRLSYLFADAPSHLSSRRPQQ